MYFLLFSALTCFSTCYCWTEKDENFCGLLKHRFESTSLSVELNVKGFHGEVITTVVSPSALSGPRVLLIHRWPRGLYVDPYQLASLSDQSEWRVLLDSVVDLEGPAHKNFGFDTLVYFTVGGQTNRFLNVTIPVHGRYHEPSHGERFVSVNVDPPELLLQADKNAQLCSLEPHTVVDAPCTADNSSTCQWVKINHQQGPGLVSFQFPVGDKSLVTPVCSGTFLVTVLCCAALSKYLWRHRII